MADNVTINEGTAKNIATDDVSGVQFQKVKLDYGGDGASVPFEGTIPEISNIVDGTLAKITSVTEVVNLATGTITKVEGGTVGEVTLVPTVTDLTSGSVRITVGTITVLPDLPGGTIDEVTEVSNVVKGTVTKVEGGTLGEVTLIPTVTNLTSGSVRVTVGTITVLPDLPGGTIDAITKVVNLETGTITRLEGGTVVVDAISFRNPDEFTATISSGTSDLGTIKPLVSGSAIYITDLIVSAGGATNVEIASGGTSTPIVGTLHFAENGGMVAPNFKTPLRTASGSALVYKQSADGPLTITATGYVD